MAAATCRSPRWRRSMAPACAWTGWSVRPRTGAWCAPGRRVMRRTRLAGRLPRGYSNRAPGNCWASESEAPPQPQRGFRRLAAAGAEFVVPDEQVAFQRPRRPQHHVQPERLLHERHAVAGLELDALVPVRTVAEFVGDLQRATQHRTRQRDPVIAQRCQAVARAQLDTKPGRAVIDGLEPVARADAPV